MNSVAASELAPAIHARQTSTDRPTGRFEGRAGEPVRLDQRAVDVGHLKPAKVWRRDNQGNGLDITDRGHRPGQGDFKVEVNL
ncbi:hypothetical protein ACIBBE_41230 [Streptomyces sp. NPDC051644]|uniref:hypothetical protein n=1 Tax=Streptomyces sp. NPDC051644 TaxID=3365666 RepID=UPI0037B9033A